jgi:uncharacterized YceG family protein
VIRRHQLGATACLFVAMVAADVTLAAPSRGATRASPPATAAPLRQFSIPFPEGYTRAQMIERVATDVRIADGKLLLSHEQARVRLSRSSYANASRAGAIPCFGNGVQENLEGFLFPSTYFFDVRTIGENVVQAQIAAFCSSWRKLDLAYAHSKNLTSYDVLKIASMVEEEAAAPGDRAKVAAVIYNRLRTHMPLGIDATLRYGLHIPPTKSITQAELNSNNPYNTRKLYGLPPTPIGNPGFASLEAAAHPSTLGYLYYVRIPGTNRSKFFESYPAFEQYLAAHGYGPHP